VSYELRSTLLVFMCIYDIEYFPWLTSKARIQYGEKKKEMEGGMSRKDPSLCHYTYME